MNLQREKVFYGNVAMLRVYCRACKGYTLVVDGIKKCCQGELRDGISFRSIRREGPTYADRTVFRPAKRLQDEILLLQEYKCAYCELPFGSVVWDGKRRKTVIQRVCWDHYIPWAYTQSHKVDFVAACQICNGMKSSHIYDSLDAAKLDIQAKRSQRGITLQP